VNQLPSSTEKTISEYLATQIAGRAFSGAQAAWCLGATGGEVFTACAGATREAGDEAVGPETAFDIASVTKLFTATAALALGDSGALDLDAPQRERATVRALLAHEAGFAPWLPLFEEVPLAYRGSQAARDRIISLAWSADPAPAAGDEAVYSDLGFMALTDLIEEAGGSRLDQIIYQTVTGPLGLWSAQFRTVSDGPTSPPGIAATEACPWRERVLTGEVHDDNAWAMGGVAGHAGLFATATDLARFGAAWLDLLKRGGPISRQSAVAATTRRPGGRGLGWDFKSETGSMAGTRFGAGSFGHLGYTGCSLWVDPDRALSVALNTNRVHYGRDNEALRRVRPEFHDLLIESLEG
jgi:CubicO group peptidase (beta-lactamase class C family)